MLYNITEEQLRVGRRMYLEALATYKKCKENDVWPGYAMGATEIDLDVTEWDMRKYKEI
ncbi:exodeoxyribonuclease VIII [Escherichia phage 2725-N35]|uniref:Exodeoxyribonuclease VIII n=1 Tax=Escherichia phage 2725-N35 TaxID=2692738 RepID=A0A6B9SPC2_9CAUD|nr:exodeoxyribonuclease VIII [Escherichia phage 2725-N35]